MSYPVVWLYGLPHAGKSSIAKFLSDSVEGAIWLDADVARATISRDLGYSAADRMENVRRLAGMALMLSMARPAVVSAVTPTAEMRAVARSLCDAMMVLVDTPAAVCELRLKKPIQPMGWEPTPYHARVDGTASAYANAAKLRPMLLRK